MANGFPHAKFQYGLHDILILPEYHWPMGKEDFRSSVETSINRGTKLLGTVDANH